MNYRNKNLIYVDGKPYRESDLRDMIAYYQQTYKPDIILPQEWHDDVNSQIFKNYPFYPTISKTTYRPELFYNQNCDLDITFKEFLDYVREEEPEQYILLMINNYEDIGIETRISAFYKEDDEYVHNSHVIDKEEGIDTSDEYRDTFINMLDFIIN